MAGNTMNALAALAEAAGLQIDWVDANGRRQRVSNEALAAILDALGLPAHSEAAIAESRHYLDQGEANMCSFVSADLGQPVRMACGFAAAGLAQLILEGGARRDVRLEREGDCLVMPDVGETGYHRLFLDDREITVAVAPGRCFGVDDASPGRRIWGPAVQIPALRDQRDTAFGDFGSLKDTVRAFAARGADLVAISPIHALFPGDPARFSPYAPSSRLFLNALYADPSNVAPPLPPTPPADLIDWKSGIPDRLAHLRRTYDMRNDNVRDAVAVYAAKGGEELKRHARFDALHAHFFRQSGAGGWQNWPDAYHDPTSSAVAIFAAAHAEEVGFYLYLQWLADISLEKAQKAGRETGMAIGLITDLAVGMDAGGSHAWSRPQELLNGLSIGAPPDKLGPDGQKWGITGFSPRALRQTGYEAFIATIRAALRHAGGIRIDHALGLRRLWVVPDHASPSDGAYLNYPLEDMLRLLALESHRAEAIVIGEDLGTVPEGLRSAMDERAMLGMRVLWFEREADGAFTPPDRWSANAVAMTGTHDLPTVAGWWCGRDIDWTWKLNRKADAANEEDHRTARMEERDCLWSAFQNAGAANGPMPAPRETSPVVDAALAYVGGTPCSIAIFPMEDIAGLVEQPNLPGTTDQHPNWRRRMPAATIEILEQPEVATRIEVLNARRSK